MVYVDDMKAPFRGMVMCHMIADTTAELVSMAKRIGVAPKWIQKKGTKQEHFDICLAMRAKAVKFGATEITWRQTGEMILSRAKNGKLKLWIPAK